MPAWINSDPLPKQGGHYNSLSNQCWECPGWLRRPLSVLTQCQYWLACGGTLPWLDWNAYQSLKCLSVRQLSWTNDSLCCLLERHDNLILWARQGTSDLGALYWGWSKLTIADKSLPWAINRIKDQQQRQKVLSVFALFASAFPITVYKDPLNFKIIWQNKKNTKIQLHH